MRQDNRAGKDATGQVGDGVGVLLQISHPFFKKVMRKQGVELKEEGGYGIAMFFFPQEALKRNQHKRLFETIVKNEGAQVLGWRKVPCDPAILGTPAQACMPYIEQAFIQKPETVYSKTRNGGKRIGF